MSRGFTIWSFFGLSGLLLAGFMIVSPPQAHAADDAPGPSRGSSGNETLPPPPDMDKAAKEADAKEQAGDYKKVIEQLLSLSPEEIVHLHRDMDARQRAAAQPLTALPSPRRRDLDIALRPGDGDPMIPLMTNYATSISIFDVTGKPWPIVKFVNGNSDDFEILQPIAKSHYLSVRPKAAYSHGNVIVYLENFSKPLVIDFGSEGKSLSSSVKIRLAARGPHAETALMENAEPRVGDPILNRFLQGVPPAQAERLRVDGADAEAWRFKGYIYLRTQATVLSPGCLQRSNDDDADNVHICKIEDISPILVSANGRQVPVKLSSMNVN